MARADPESIQFKTASGRILSPEHSKAVLARLAGADQNPDSLARHLALEQEISGTPLSLGNRVVLLEDGPNTYAAMLAAIEAARDHINMETYILEDDEAGQRFAAALIAKRAPGRAGQPDPRQRRHAAARRRSSSSASRTPASPCSSSIRSIRSPPRRAGR